MTTPTKNNCGSLADSSRHLIDTGTRIRIVAFGGILSVYLDDAHVEVSLTDAERLRDALAQAIIEYRKPDPRDPRD